MLVFVVYSEGGAFYSI